MAEFKLQEGDDRKGFFGISVEGSPPPTAEEQELLALFRTRIDLLLQSDRALDQLRGIADRWIVQKTVQAPEALIELRSTLATSEDPIYAGKFFTVWSRIDDDGNARRMQIAAKPGAEIPQDYIDLKVALERTESIILLLFPEPKIAAPLSWYSLFRQIDRLVPHVERPKARRKQYLDALFGIAATGLGQDNVRLADLALKHLQAEIIDREAGTVKNTYLRQLGVNALLLLVAIPLGAYLFIDRLCNTLTCSAALYHKNYLVLIAGAAVGAWLSFSIRRPTIGFRELVVLEEDRLDPRVRLFFVVGLACVIGLLLHMAL